MITLITGGARSGKSNFANKLAEKLSKDVVYIATCQPKDEEMKLRIGIHKSKRPKNWKIIEEPKDIDKVLSKFNSKNPSAMVRHPSPLVLLDCLTLLISNLMLDGLSEKKILDKIKKAIEIIKRKKINAIIVTNEVGMGIVPENRLARDFRDVQGKVNQVVAKEADKVYLLVSGMPVEIRTPHLRVGNRYHTRKSVESKGV